METPGIRSQEWVDQIERLVRQAEALPDPKARGIAVDLVQAVLEFHAAGLRRLLEIIEGSGDAAQAALRQIAADDLTGSLLLLHDIHPDDLETRVERAAKQLGEMFASLGAKLTLTAIEGTTVRVRFDSARTWSGTPVKASVENAILGAAPEIATVVIEGLKETPPADFVPVSELIGSHL